MMPAIHHNNQRIMQSGARFNIKMLTYQFRKSHCGDKTIRARDTIRNDQEVIYLIMWFSNIILFGTRYDPNLRKYMIKTIPLWIQFCIININKFVVEFFNIKCGKDNVDQKLMNKWILLLLHNHWMFWSDHWQMSLGSDTDTSWLPDDS